MPVADRAVAAPCRDSRGITRRSASRTCPGSYRVGAAPSRGTLQAGDLPEPAAVLEGPPKAVLLQHLGRELDRGLLLGKVGSLVRSSDNGHVRAARRRV